MRPLQCPICTGLLLNPVTLPCGFTLCQHCLPPLQPIAYQLQVKCPFPPCNRGGLHTKKDIRHIDVSLQNLTTLVRTASSLSSNKNILSEEAANARQHLQPDTLYYGQPAPGWDATLDGLFDPYEPVRPSPSSSSSTASSLPTPPSPPSPPPSSLTSSSCLSPSAQYKVIQPNLPTILASVQHKVQQEIECQVCFLVFCRPITTVCGHTFCKACLIRSLDHKNTCPLCRTDLPLYMHYHNQAPNKILSRFIQYLASSKSDIPSFASSPSTSSGDHTTIMTLSTTTTTPSNTSGNNNNSNNNPWNISIDESENEIEPSLAMTPLFVNSLIFPRMPCYLLVFEPRYQRLLRNVLKTESKLFGMVLPPRQQRKKHHHNHNDGIGAWEPSMEYGTLLKIVSFEPLQDGRALVETVGVSRFQVLTYAMLEGYYTATSVELIHDIPEEQEVGLEKAVLHAVAHERIMRQEAEKPGSAAESNEEQDEVDFILGSRPAPSSPLQGGYEDIEVSTLNSNSSRRASALDLDTTTASTGTTATDTTDLLLSSFSSPPEDLDRPGTGQWSSRRLLDSTADLSDLHTQDLETLSRRQLMDILLAFVSHMQDRLGPLATQRLQREFGEMIEDNGEYFSFWVASILPVRNYQKYELLKQTSVRRRLLTVVGWIKEIEQRRSMSVCTIS